jgi:hypothetical protein
MKFWVFWNFSFPKKLLYHLTNSPDETLLAIPSDETRGEGFFNLSKAYLFPMKDLFM